MYNIAHFGKNLENRTKMKSLSHQNLNLTVITTRLTSCLMVPLTKRVAPRKTMVELGVK